MTEQEWLTCADPLNMLAFLKTGVLTLVDDPPASMAREAFRHFVLGRVARRRRMLFACGCCRRIWDVLKDDRSRQAIEVAERSADGLASDDELAKAQSNALQARDAVAQRGMDRTVIHTARVAAHAVWEAVCCDIERSIAGLAEAEAWGGISSSETDARAHQAAILLPCQRDAATAAGP
jgi:hypothetical protein